MLLSFEGFNVRHFFVLSASHHWSLRLTIAQWCKS